MLARKYRVSLSQNKAAFFWTLVLVALTIGSLYLIYTPPGTRMGPEQPIPFSHQLHVGVKSIQCQFCHPYVDSSIHPGLPPVEKCLYCHNYIIAKHPQILKEHRYFNTKTPTPWVKANYLAEHVVFNHQRHIKKEIECQQCHGAIETMDRVKGRYFYMEFCIQCHREKKANLGCWLACHS
ncbi:MAG: cytochrome c family protein [Deltaproteobacteria bacterium SG8_13]|nr:MAG: cytochrome c family protein [Deltaproteobacteria bacterium SG8_13]